MILATLDRSHEYLAIHAGLQAGFEFLRRADLGSLDAGRHEIDGDRIFAIVARERGRGREDSPLEFHRRYLDIQYVIEGTDVIGWAPIDACHQLRQSYDADADIGFFHDRPGGWLNVPAGCFAIFLPSDAHAPLAGAGPIHKVVVKVQVAG